MLGSEIYPTQFKFQLENRMHIFNNGGDIIIDRKFVLKPGQSVTIKHGDWEVCNSGGDAVVKCGDMTMSSPVFSGTGKILFI